MVRSYADKVLIAEKLRSSRGDSVSAPESYRRQLAECVIRELSIETREGSSRAVLIDPSGGNASLSVYFNLHDGNFVMGRSLSDLHFCGMLARQAACKVVDIDYRQAPEHPFPAALNECHDAIAWVRARGEELGVQPHRIAIGGFGAGANIAASVAMMAGRTCAFELRGLVLATPFFGDAADPAGRNLASEHALAPLSQLFLDLYEDDPHDRANPLFSQLSADPELLAALPAALVVSAGLDPMRGAAESFAELLCSAGGTVSLRRFAESGHGFADRFEGEYVPAHRVIVESVKSFL